MATDHRCPDYEPCIPCAQEEAFEDGMLRGIAAYVGVIGMFNIIGARARAKPPASLGLYPCQRRHPDVPVRCNLENDHDGPHKHISQHGNMLHEWPQGADT